VYDTDIFTSEEGSLILTYRNVEILDMRSKSFCLICLVFLNRPDCWNIWKCHKGNYL